MRKNVGRPPKSPSGPSSSLTLILPAEVKTKLIVDASAYDMTLTEYIVALIQKNN